MTQTRVLDLQGVHNFRDYGGYAVAGGGRVRRGVLWRSGQHFGATDSDLERIAALGLAAVYDLRSQRERTIDPCCRPQDFAARIVFSDVDTRGVAPHVAAGAQVRSRDAASMREALRRSYRTIPFRPGLVGMFRTYLAEQADLDGASLINCMAGKDRTGFAVAMLHSVLGVHRDDVMADYLLTNTAGDVEARIAAGGEAIRKTLGEIEREALRALMAVEAEYLNTAYTVINERHGSLEAYLAAELGVDAALQERLRARLVE